MTKKLNLSLLLTIVALVGLALSFTFTAAYAQSDDEYVEVTSEAEATEDDAEVINSDQTEPFETGLNDSDPALDGDDETTTLNDDVEVTEEVVEGEVVEINDNFIVIQTEDGERVTISRGGGAMLSPFVRQANIGNLKVGDQVEVTVATEAKFDGEVSGVNTDGSLVVKTSDGQTRTIQPGANDVVVRKNGKVVTDFSTLNEGDDIELVYGGELISDVDLEDGGTSGGWVVPVLVILIVLALAGILSKRNAAKGEL